MFFLIWIGLWSVAASAAEVQCRPSPNIPGEFGAYNSQGQLIGDYFFQNQKDCLAGISKADRGLVCAYFKTPLKKPFAIPYDFKTKVRMRNELGSLENCVSKLDRLTPPRLQPAIPSSDLPFLQSHCQTEVRLDVPGGSMEFVGVRDQKKRKTCYAETAAQMRDAWRFAHTDRNYDQPTRFLEDWDLGGEGRPEMILEKLRLDGDPIPESKFFMVYESTPTSVLVAFLDRLPNSQAMPFAPLHCENVFKSDSTYRGVYEKGEISDTCRTHITLIIGKRPNQDTGRCEFLIRNSWGENCGPLVDPWKCEKGTGSFWIDAEALVANTHGWTEFTETK
ncbi:hypothetical protein K2X30_10480 [bacterium]|jgi:hypothetical protein|nr:hypothetical protein [bacterium]